MKTVRSAAPVSVSLSPTVREYSPPLYSDARTLSFPILLLSSYKEA
jgi:hypothetical protein